MVRTAGIRVSAGRSSKKVGKSVSSSNSSSNSSKSGGNSSTKLPPIPHQETPSWQKPITNFFKSNSPVKQQENRVEENEVEENEAGPSKKKLKLDGKEKLLSENTQDNVKDVPEANKENDLKNNVEEFDEGASTSNK